MALKTFLVIVNPNGGRRQGLKIFNRYVRPEFEKANLLFTLIITEKRDHAREIAYNLILNKWEALIIISGDGLIHEVINGLMSRPDWSDAIKMPIGIIPGGTGNALHTSLCHQYGTYSRDTFIHECLRFVIKGTPRPLDLLRITIPHDGKVYYSVLGFAWGLISDIDAESELLRYVGDFRYILYGLWRIQNLRYYRGSISYSPSDPPSSLAPPTNLPTDHRSDEVVKDSFLTRFLDRFKTESLKSAYTLVVRSTTYLCGICWHRPKRGQVPLVESGIPVSDRGDSSSSYSYDRNFEILTVPPSATSSLPYHPNPVILPKPDNHFTEISLIDPTPASTNAIIISDNNPRIGTNPRSIRDFDLSSNTKMMEEIVALYVCNVSHISQEFTLTPTALTNDGLAHLCLVRKGVSKSQMLKFLFNAIDVTAIDPRFASFIPIRKFTLIPYKSTQTLPTSTPITQSGKSSPLPPKPDGPPLESIPPLPKIPKTPSSLQRLENIMTIDGEIIPCSTVQIEVLPGIARILAP